MSHKIVLGGMPIDGGIWRSGYETDSDSEEDDDFASDDSPKEKVDPDEIVIPDDNVIIIFSYPLKEDFQFEFEHKGGFTRKQISEVIMQQYASIYAEEEQTAPEGDPGHLPHLIYNRATSTGKYGIWGHDIGDLYLHSLYKQDDGTYTLGVDS